MAAEVILRLGGFKKLRKSLRGPSGNVAKALERWVPIYRRFVFERFLRFSSGGGNWKKLPSAYVAAKRASGLSPKILQRTRLLRTTIRPSSRVLTRRTKQGIYVKFAPTKRYPGGLKVNRVIDIHDKGKGRQARRTILVSPTNRVFQEMVKTTEQGFKDDLN